MRRNLTGKTAVIFGASSGIGAAIAMNFAAAGSRLVLSSRRPERLQLLTDKIVAGGGEALAVVADVTDFNQVRNVIDRTIESFGGVDILVNSAGLGIPDPLELLTPQNIDDQIDVNFKGVCYGCKAVLTTMIAGGGGDIVNMATAVPQGYRGSVAEAAGHAVRGFSLALQAELEESGIRVSSFLAGSDLPSTDEELAELIMVCVSMPNSVRLQLSRPYP